MCHISAKCFVLLRMTLLSRSLIMSQLRDLTYYLGIKAQYTTLDVVNQVTKSEVAQKSNA